MRLRGISDMAAGNAYLPEFMADFNRRFAVAPRSPEDAHRAVLRDAEELDLIFCEHHRRKLTKNLTIRFECREYQATGRGRGYRPRGAEVTACKAFDGSATVLREGRELPARLLARGEEPIPLEDGKTVRERGGRRMKPRAPANAPWTCGRVPRTGARPSGRVDSPWTTRSADSPSIRRCRRALPTGCPHSRASRPQPHSSSNKVFFSKKRGRPEPQKGDISSHLRCTESHEKTTTCGPPIFSLPQETPHFGRFPTSRALNPRFPPQRPVITPSRRSRNNSHLDTVKTPQRPV